MADEITVAVVTVDQEGTENVSVSTTRQSKGTGLIENALSSGGVVIAAHDKETVQAFLDDGFDAVDADEKAAARITELEAEVVTLTTNLQSREADMVNLSKLHTQANERLVENDLEPIANPDAPAEEFKGKTTKKAK